MLERTVVCWNGTPAAEAALRWALRRARAAGTTVEVFDVVERALFEGDGQALERASVQEEQRLASRLDELSATEPGVVFASALLVGDPLDVLVEQTGADTLVVVGTSHRVGPRMRYGWSLGSRMATAAAGPVAVVPVEEDVNAQGRSGVVVGVDGSETGRRALDFAAAEAAVLQQPLTVVHCWQESLVEEPLVVPDGAFVDSQEAAHQELLDEQVRALRDARPDLHIVSVLVRQNPISALRVQSETAFMLVVGSRRLTGWKRTSLGSVSRGLLLDLVAPTVVVGPRGVNDAGG